MLAVLASARETSDWAAQHANGTKMPVIPWRVLREMIVVIPPQSVIQEFHKLVGPILGLIRTLSSVVRNTRTTRDFLLPRLMSGGIDVENLDIAMPDVAV